LPFAVIEQIFEGRTQQIHDHHRVVPLLTEPMDFWNANPIMQDFIKFRLIEELGMLGLGRLQLDCGLFVGFNVYSYIFLI
jgi:hypothetical protein